MIEEEFGVPIPGEILPEDRWAKTAIKRLPPPGPLDWSAIFGRAAPVVLELGCGNGRYTLQSALARPEVDHFATDILPVVIRYATRRANQRGLSNVRFAVKDAQTLVRAYAGASSIAEIHLYHPQPYHDPRQAHLRLVTPRFLTDVHRALRPGGLFVIQTDNPDYWAYMTRLLPVFLDFHEQPGPWPDAPQGRSRREILARSRGLKIFRGYGTRRDDLAPDRAIALAESLPPPTFRSRGPWLDLDALE
jgi:tRNA (guanine-N7-)-methyltransferase